jgi:hypothetical protein
MNWWIKFNLRKCFIVVVPLNIYSTFCFMSSLSIEIMTINYIWCCAHSLEIFGKIWISTTIVFRQSQTFVLRHYRNENESSFSVLFHILLISIYFIWIINWRMNGKRLPFKKKKKTIILNLNMYNFLSYSLIKHSPLGKH